MKIDNISNEAKQSGQIMLPNREIVNWNILYSDITNSWFISILYKTFQTNFLKIVYSDNILNKYSNILPFRISCKSNTGFSPYFQNDFTNGNNELHIELFNEI